MCGHKRATDLEAAKPALNEAEAALDAIKAEDVKNLAKLGKPPEVIKVIFDAMMILKHSLMLKCKLIDIKGYAIYEPNYAVVVGVVPASAQLRWMD